MAAVVFWMIQANQLWFFLDDFTPLYHRALTWHDINVPQNEHWVALPILLFKVIQGAVGMTYFPFALLPVLAHVTAAGVFYWLFIRSGLRPWAAVATVAIFAFAANGDNILWAFQVGFIGSVALGLLAIASVDELSRLRWQALAANGFLVLSLSCGSVGMTMLIWVGVYALMRRNIRTALACTLPAVMVYVLWYVSFDPISGERETSLERLGPFWWLGVTKVWDLLLGVQGMGLLIFIALSAGALLLPATPRARVLAVSGIATIAPAYLLLAVSRAVISIEYAGTPRYVYFGLMLMTPALAVCLHHASKSLPASVLQRTCVGVCVTAVVVVTQIAVTLAFTQTREAAVEVSLERVIAGRQILKDPDARVMVPETALFDPTIPQVVMKSDGIVDVLPVERGLEPGPQAVADAQAILQLAAGAEDLNLPSAAAADVAGAPVEVGSDCTQEYGTEGPISVVVHGTPDGVQVGLAAPVDSVLIELLSGLIASSPARATPLVGPDKMTYIGTSAPNVWMRITITNGPVRLCNP